MWNQRSVDTFLGLPFNIASYALLLEIIGKIVNMVPEELIGNLGDTHLYSNHVNQAIQQIGVNLSLDEYIKLYNPETWEKVVKLRAEKHVAIKLENYQEAANIKHLEKEVLGLIEDIDIETREPFDLPKLVFDFNNEELIGDVLKQLSPKSFKLDGYKSHAEIKAPLSN
jgi:thymidylate synthase